MPDEDATRDKAVWIEQALERYEGPLIRYAARFTGDLELAREVVQETFLRLCQADRARIEGRLAAWLYTVCRNRAIDVRRKEGRLQTVDETRAVSIPSWDPSPGTLAEQSEAYAAVLRVLDGLPPNQQEVIRLKFGAGLSYKEISSVTGLSTSNVGYLIHMGVKALRRELHVEAELGQQRSVP